MSAPSSPIRVKAPGHVPNSPSERLRQKISETYEYFLNEVDPVVGSCIQYMLMDQPLDVIDAMISYFKLYKGNKGSVNLERLHMKSHRSEEMKNYLHNKLGPVLVKLAGNAVKEQPEDIVEYLMDQLAKMKEAPLEITPLS